MTIGIVSAAYIAAAVLFILSLGGLSGQESAKRAVWYGIIGMGLAVVATETGKIACKCLERGFSPSSVWGRVTWVLKDPDRG